MQVLLAARATYREIVNSPVLNSIHIEANKA